MKAAKAIPALTEKDKARFWAKVDKSGPTQPHMDSPCWVWTAYRISKGYGLFSVGDGLFLAHRIAFALNGGVLDSTTPCACHHCDFPSCCNPSHLFAGTNSDNSKDREAKGRGNHPNGDAHHSRRHPEQLRRGDNHPAHVHPERMARGASHGRVKLTNEQIQEIRSRFSAGGISKVQLGKDYGVNNTMIGFIIRRKNWKHIA